SAPTAPRRFRGFADPVARLQTLRDQVVAHRGQEVDLAFFRRCEQQRVARGALLDRVHRTEELVIRRAGHLADDELAVAERRCGIEKLRRDGADVETRRRARRLLRLLPRLQLRLQLRDRRLSTTLGTQWK